MSPEKEVYNIVLDKKEIGKDKIEKTLTNLGKLIASHNPNIPINVEQFFSENPHIERHVSITNGNGNVKCEIKNKASIKGAYRLTEISSEKYFDLDKDLKTQEKP